MLIRVAPFSGSFDTHGLTYKVPESFQKQIQLYQFVEVPLKNGTELGIILEVNTTFNGDDLKVREIHSLVSEEVFLSDDMKLLLEWMSQYYITPIHTVLHLFFPKNLREKIAKLQYRSLKEKDYHYHLDFRNTLQPIQQKVLEKLQKSGFPVTLFYGVTGAGKTHIYQELAREEIKKGKSVLILVPEIVLTSQVAKEFQKNFGEDVIILTSDVTEAKKSQYWKDIYDSRAKLVVGTRSALFYPYQNLSLVIMDEEHDESYNSDKSPRYHTRELLHFLAQL